MNRTIKNILVGFVCVAIPTLALAQHNTTTQHLLWTRYNLQLKVAPNYTLKQEIEERVYWFPWRQHQLMMRTQVARALGKNWNGALGFTYMRQSLPQKQEFDTIFHETELRPQIEFDYQQMLNNRFKLSHRYRLDFRFFENPEGGFTYGNMRARYHFQASYNLTKKVSFRAFDEIMLHIGAQNVVGVFDQNRIGASIKFDFNSVNSIELGYFNWYQERASGVDFYNRHIVRFTYAMNLDFSKPKDE